MKSQLDSSVSHVLVIPAWYPNGIDKLIGVYHKEFTAALSKQGVKANLLFIDRQGVRLWPKYPLMKKWTEEPWEGFTAYIRKMPDLSKISYDLQMKAYVHYLTKLYRRYEKIHGRPDVIHAQVAVPAGYAAVKLGEKLGIPVVYTEHSSYFERFFTGSEGKYGEYAAKNSAAVTCVSGYMVEGYKKVNVEASVLPNIVDTGLFSRPKQPVGDGKLRFITVSALRPGKLIDDAIKALKLLRDEEKIPPFEYIVVGDGTEESRFRALASELDMNDCVKFVGRKNRDEVAALLSQSDVLLMVSELETFGIPAIEAMAAGLPVVSTRCRGPEEFLTEEVSEFCDPYDVEGLSEAICRMVSRLPEIGEDTLRAAAARFDGENIARRAIKLYESVCK